MTDNDMTDAELFAAADEADRLRVELEAIDALRPPCPHPGCVNGEILADLEGEKVACSKCPENGGNCDGKVSIEQLAATWRAVWDCPIRVSTTADEIEIAKCKGHNGLRDRLRAVRP